MFKDLSWVSEEFNFFLTVNILPERSSLHLSFITSLLISTIFSRAFPPPLPPCYCWPFWNVKKNWSLSSRVVPTWRGGVEMRRRRGVCLMLVLFCSACLMHRDRWVLFHSFFVLSDDFEGGEVGWVLEKVSPSCGVQGRAFWCKVLRRLNLWPRTPLGEQQSWTSLCGYDVCQNMKAFTLC